MGTAATYSSPSAAHIRPVTLEHPWRWLAAGWNDLAASPRRSLAWGLLYAVGGYALLFGLRQVGLDYLIVPLGLGFTLVGPLAAIGLMESSRRRAGPAAAAGRGRNFGQFALLGLFMMLVFVAWVRLAMLEFMLFFGPQPPTLDGILQAVFTTDRGAGLLLVGGLSGFMMAGLVFAMTAVAVPMLLDHSDCDAVTAMLTSFDACRHNFKAMSLWAFLIAGLTLGGLVLMFVGLVVALPLVGHASWHAYRDLVQDGS